MTIRASFAFIGLARTNSSNDYNYTLHVRHGHDMTDHLESMFSHIHIQLLFSI